MVGKDKRPQHQHHPTPSTSRLTHPHSLGFCLCLHDQLGPEQRGVEGEVEEQPSLWEKDSAEGGQIEKASAFCLGAPRW